MPSTDAEEVLAVIHERIGAMRRKDAAAANNHLAHDIVAFEVAGPLVMPAAQATDTAGFQQWLDTWEWIDVEVRDEAVAASGDVAFCHALHRLHGVQQGEAIEMWSRSTLCLRKLSGTWKIVHGHTSFPFATDGSFRAQLDLKP